MEKEERRRKEAIRRYLAEEKARQIWEDLDRSESWFYKWLKRYREGDPNWFQANSRAPNSVPNKTDPEIEQLIIDAREKLEQQKYAQVGSLAIQWELKDKDIDLPSTRTIDRILRRNDKTNASQPYEPKGTDYPAVAADRPGVLHQVDFLGPRYIAGDGRFYSLNLMDVACRKVALNPTRRQSAFDVTTALIATWKRMFLPAYLQMDNAMCFRGSNRYPRSFGTVVRMCLHLGITPVFIPVREPWRNGHIERFQDTWGQKFFQSQGFVDFNEIEQETSTFEIFHNHRRHRQKSLVAS